MALQPLDPPKRPRSHRRFGPRHRRGPEAPV